MYLTFGHRVGSSELGMEIALVFWNFFFFIINLIEDNDVVKADILQSDFGRLAKGMGQ